MKSSDIAFFHECEVKYRVPSQARREAWERRLRSIGFTYKGRQLERDFIPDTEDFACRAHGLMLRFRHIQTDDGRQDIVLTTKLEGRAEDFQERFELEYPFSAFNHQLFVHINAMLHKATGKELPLFIHSFAPDQFDNLCKAVATLFPMLRIRMDKKRIIYHYDVYHALFDTLPVGMGEYLELEAPSPASLTLLQRALLIDDDYRTPYDYGELLIRHQPRKTSAAQRTGIFRVKDRSI